MPNYCHGSLEISGSKAEVKKVFDFIHGVEDGEELIFDFNKVIPMPENEKDNWYDWSCENWGTKWNAEDCEIYGNGISFWTAWTPCSPVIKKLASLFPLVDFYYFYDECGMCFSGIEKYHHGELVYETDCEYICCYYYDDEPLPEKLKIYQNRNGIVELPTNVVDGWEVGNYLDCDDDGENMSIRRGTYRRKLTYDECPDSTIDRAECAEME